MADSSEWPAVMIAGGLVGGLLGAGVGYAASFGLDILNDPLSPKVESQPGWWMVGGGVGGAGFGSIIAAGLMGLWRMIFRKK
jgi:hypothetical protein